MMTFALNVGEKNMGKSKMSKACDISPKVRKEVMERDGCKCVICGRNDLLQIAHFVSRARGGLGIAKNLAVISLSL